MGNPVVQIEGVGNVQFPASMSEDDINQAAHKLYTGAAADKISANPPGISKPTVNMKTSLLGDLAPTYAPRTAHAGASQAGLPGYEGSLASGDTFGAAGMSGLGVATGAALAAPAVVGGASALAAKYPTAARMVASEGINQAKKIPVVGKFIPPGAEILPWLLGGGGAEPAEEGAPAEEAAEAPKKVGAAVERDATRENVPYAGEEEAAPKAKQVGEPQWPANYTQPKQVGGGANYSAEDLAKLKARNGIADVPSEKVGEAKPTVNSVGNQIESALGGKKLIPNVPLRQQLPALQKGPVAMAEPEHMGQFARANSLELHKAIPETVEGDVLRARIHNLSNVDVRQLAIDSGEDMGQMRVGNRKGTDDLPRQEVLKRILSHHTPEQIGELMDKRAKQGNTP